jgi:hypothetical protein
MSLTNLPEVVKSVIYEEEMCICTHRSVRSDWGERASKRTKGEPWETHSIMLVVALPTEIVMRINNCNDVAMGVGAARSSWEVDVMFMEQRGCT